MNPFLPERADTGRNGPQRARKGAHRMTPNAHRRELRARPDLDQLKRQAKELLAAFRAGEPDAVAEVVEQFRGANPETFALHDAQLVIARSHGFASWPK